MNKLTGTILFAMVHGVLFSPTVFQLWEAMKESNNSAVANVYGLGIFITTLLYIVLVMGWILILNSVTEKIQRG